MFEYRCTGDHTKDTDRLYKQCVQLQTDIGKIQDAYEQMVELKQKYEFQVADLKREVKRLRVTLHEFSGWENWFVDDESNWHWIGDKPPQARAEAALKEE